MRLARLYGGVVLLSFCTIGYTYITYIATRLPLKGNRSDPGAPWPLPASWEKSPVVRILDPNDFEIRSNLESCDVISFNIRRYSEIIFRSRSAKIDTSGGLFPGLNVTVVNTTQCGGYPDMDSDESYSLEVGAAGASLTANSVWGAIRGLETFSQLVYIEGNEYKINETIIRDKPRFQYRGVMLDTARHFISKSLLFKNLDAMSYNKLNVFHWHIVDDQSFPYQSVKFPQLSDKGAYSPRHTYTQRDVRDIIEYARLRGIRVIPKLLTPCWVDGQPGRGRYNFHGDYEIFNPAVNSTFQFLEEFFSEVDDVFPGNELHLGFDEAYRHCWRSNPDVGQFMAEHNISTYGDLEAYYVTRVMAIARGLGRRPIIWQDPLEHSAVDVGGALVEVWKNRPLKTWQKYMDDVTGRGYDAILSACWYLNYISYGQDWRAYYACDPQEFNGTEEQNRLVRGGEACLWAEYIDGTNLLPLLWPRASAVAERLWSARGVVDADSAAFRLDQQRCRLISRGIPAKPILNGFCDDDVEDTSSPTPSTTTPVPVCVTRTNGALNQWPSVIGILYYGMTVLLVSEEAVVAFLCIHQFLIETLVLHQISNVVL
ncbi:hypothetical protein ScPMuIL_010281 [Solemya velum]